MKVFAGLLAAIAVLMVGCNVNFAAPVKIDGTLNNNGDLNVGQQPSKSSDASASAEPVEIKITPMEFNSRRLGSWEDTIQMMVIKITNPAKRRVLMQTNTFPWAGNADPKQATFVNVEALVDRSSVGTVLTANGDLQYNGATFGIEAESFVLFSLSANSRFPEFLREQLHETYSGWQVTAKSFSVVGSGTVTIVQPISQLSQYCLYGDCKP